jgi:hypothetical protein
MSSLIFKRLLHTNSSHHFFVSGHFSFKCLSTFNPKNRGYLLLSYPFLIPHNFQNPAFSHSLFYCSFIDVALFTPLMFHFSVEYEENLHQFFLYHYTFLFLRILFALLSTWMCQIYVKPIFSNSSSIPLSRLLPLGYLPVIHNTFVLVAGSTCVIHVTGISQSCSELFRSYWRALIPVHLRRLVQILALLLLLVFYKTYCEFYQFISIFHLGPISLCHTPF